MGKEVFLRCPPPSFDRDFEGDERRRSHDTDEDWLPDVQGYFLRQLPRHDRYDGRFGQ